MGAQPKYSKQKMEQAIKRYANGEPVRSLAKEYKISVPGMYLWIAKARNAAASAPRSYSTPDGVRAAPSAATAAHDSKVPMALRVKALEQENERLRRRILDLMLKHNEL